MEAVQHLFLHILSSALRDETASLPRELTGEEWEAVVSLAREHDVLPLVYEAVYSLPGAKDQPVLAAAKNQVRQKVMIQAIKTNAFLNLNRQLRSAGVKALVVKGLVCRELYPQPDSRPSNDEDVLVAPGQYDAAHEVFTAFGMVPAQPEMAREGVYEVPYCKPGSPLFVELHKHLFPPESEAYGELNRFFAGVFDRAVEERFLGQWVLTMDPTDHFFYLICHSFKHFLHSGFGIRQVCDICLFAKKYGSAIHWDQVLHHCRSIRAHRFTAALLAIGRKHLGIDLDSVPLGPEWRALEADEGPILEDLLSSGTFGGGDRNRKNSAGITLAAVASQKQGKKEGGGLMKSLFPSAKTLEGRYPYLQKQPWLLPAAWVTRLAKYADETRSGEKSAAQAIKIGSERIRLLKTYGILED